MRTKFAVIVMLAIVLWLGQTARAECLNGGRHASGWYSVTVTAYCPCRKCCGRWARTHGGALAHRTASGVVPVAGRTVAAPRCLAFGTAVFIPAHGWRIVEDRTAARFDGRFDLFVETHAAARRLGIQKTSVFIVP